MGFIAAVRADSNILLIPVIAGIIGWVTNVAAVYMLFYPVEFRGIRPYIGWQGVIPNASKRMGRYLAELIATRLVDVKEMLAGLDAEKMLPALRPALWKLADSVIGESAGRFAAPMWNGMDDKAKSQVRESVRKEVEKLAVSSLGDLRSEAHELIDVANAIEEAISRDKSLLNNLFLVAGSEEFKFIKISGLYFGFLFGIPQMVIWVYYPEWWTLPFAGLLVGYVTNWLAMKMIFEPKTPKKIGPFEFHGLFHKRQKEVAGGFSDTVTTTILTPANIVGQISAGPGLGRIRGIFQKRVGETLELYRKHPVAAMLLKQVEPAEIDRIAARNIDAGLMESDGILWNFVSHTVDVKDAMAEKLKNLDPETFESVLRPAFQQDEWKLIAVGAVLGLVAGWAQAVYMFGATMG